MEAGVTPQILNDAITSFILEIIVRHGKPAKFLCNKDPFTLKSTVLVIEPVLKLFFGSINTIAIFPRKMFLCFDYDCLLRINFQK